MKLGNFSVSLAVKDLAASRAFYEKLGFSVHGGDETAYVMMRNGETILGLFQGMFEKNILTFNPRWDRDCKVVDGEDVREIRQNLLDQGITLLQDATVDNPEGPASLVIEDPDGNPVLIDQHC